MITSVKILILWDKSFWDENSRVCFHKPAITVTAPSLTSLNVNQLALSLCNNSIPNYRLGNEITGLFSIILEASTVNQAAITQ